MLHIVQFGKLASIIWRHILLELIERLPCQVGAVYQEEYTPCPTKLNQAIDAANRRIRLAAPRRHLDQCSRSILSKRAFKLGNSFYLAVTQSRVRQRRQTAQPGAQRIILLVGNILRSLSQPFCQRLRPVEGKDRTTARLRLEVTGKTRLDPRSFITERQ